MKAQLPAAVRDGLLDIPQSILFEYQSSSLAEKSEAETSAKIEARISAK